jgi:hypothetical protein
MLHHLKQQIESNGYEDTRDTSDGMHPNEIKSIEKYQRNIYIYIYRGGHIVDREEKTKKRHRKHKEASESRRHQRISRMTMFFQASTKMKIKPRI